MLKASLISNKEISSFFRPDMERTLVMAATGAVGKSIGAQAASAKPGKLIDHDVKEFLAPQLRGYIFLYY